MAERLSAVSPSFRVCRVSAGTVENPMGSSSVCRTSDVPLPALQAVSNRHTIKTGRCLVPDILWVLFIGQCSWWPGRDIQLRPACVVRFILLLRHSLCQTSFLLWLLLSCFIWPLGNEITDSAWLAMYLLEPELVLSFVTMS